MIPVSIELYDLLTCGAEEAGNQWIDAAATAQYVSSLPPLSSGTSKKTYDSVRVARGSVDADLIGYSASGILAKLVEMSNRFCRDR